MRDSSRLQEAGVRPTDIRLRVFGAVSAAGQALSPGDILALLRRERATDKVSVYRALDVLVDGGLLVRTSGPDRSYRYCAGSGGADVHGHFYCTQCGAMGCLAPGAVSVSRDALPEGCVATGLEVRLEGVCASCRATGKN